MTPFRRFRAKQGLSQSEMARALHSSTSTIQRLERKGAVIRGEMLTLIRLCNKYKISLKD